MAHIEQKHHDFFGTGIKPQAFSLEAAPSNVNGLINFLILEQEVPAAVQADLDSQKQNVTDLAGIGNAYTKQQANNSQNPDLVFDPNLWLRLYNNLPLMGPSQFNQRAFNQSIQGTSIATAFLQTIMGFSVSAGPALAAFSDFLGTLGGQIKAGVSVTQKNYTATTVAATLVTQSMGNGIIVEAYLKLYSILFSMKEAKIYSSCSSSESFEVNFNYREATALFNAGALKNPKVKQDFDLFISGTQNDDIRKAQNFFETQVQKAS